RNLREPGGHLLRVEKDNSAGVPAEFDRIQKNHMVEAGVDQTPNEPLRRPARDDELWNAAVLRRNAFAFPDGCDHVRPRSGQGFRQAHAEGVIAAIRVADAQQADAALETAPELFEQAGHQMSSPSF